MEHLGLNRGSEEISEENANGRKNEKLSSERVPAGPPRLFILLATFAAVYLIWGSTYLGIKFAIETIPPLLMAGTRFLTGGATLYLLARWQGGKGSTRAANASLVHWRSAV